MKWVQSDGGRAAAGFKGTTGDCSTRAIAIATGLPYREVYDLVTRFANEDRFLRGRVPTGKPSARTGAHIKTIHRVLGHLGWSWVPTMHIGHGCRVHLCANELPAGRIIARVSRHLVAVIDGVAHDNYDPSRGGRRCVYGYWRKRPCAAQLGDEDEFAEDLESAIEKAYGRREPKVGTCDACGSGPVVVTPHVVAGEIRWLCAIDEGGADS